jgi:thioredoxin 1
MRNKRHTKDRYTTGSSWAVDSGRSDSGLAGRDVEGDAVVAAVGAHVDEARKAGVERVELGAVGFDLGQLGSGRDEHGVGTSTVGGEQQLTDLGEGEAEGLRAPNELQPRDVVVGVLAVLGAPPRGPLNQPAAFVVANRLDADVGGAGEIPDRERAHRPTVPPVPGYGVKASTGLTPYLRTGRTVTRMNMTELTDSRFDEFVSGTDLPVLVEFTAQWCSPCHALAPVLHELADEQAGRLLVGAIDVDENPAATRRHDVMSMPTLIVFVDGHERKRLVGARGKARLLQELAEYLRPTVATQ